MQRLAQSFTNLFALWVILAGVIGWFWPAALGWVNGSLISILLGLIMLGMGLNLSPADFQRILRKPLPVLAGVLLQYTLMPALGFTMAWLFQLDNELATGLILVAACPGGTASNVITFLARANLELSVSMTALSTLLAILMTPLLTTWLAGNRLDIPTAGLLLDTLLVVILPVSAGIILNRFLRQRMATIRIAAAPIAVIAIALIVGSILGARREAMLANGWQLVLAVAGLHAAGFGLGWLAGRVFGDRNTARTISIEVGMQNSGLGAKLADSNFPAHPMVALPSAISAMTHCILGSLAVLLWRLVDRPKSASRSQGQTNTVGQ
ncbi:MAG: bile acid:sodium symporter family protein [Leptospiraceae bacterium]|nr:bile acid:sodium symporter family protein [Leptospiraceae bacterium]